MRLANAEKKVGQGRIYTIKNNHAISEN